MTLDNLLLNESLLNVNLRVFLNKKFEDTKGYFYRPKTINPISGFMDMALILRKQYCGRPFNR